MKKVFFLTLGLLSAFFLDSQLSYLLSNLTGYHLVFTSYLFLILLSYIGLSTRTIFFYPLLIVLGIFYDAQYLGALGLSVWLLPCCLYLYRLFRSLVLVGRLERFLFLMVLIFTFSTSLYGIAYLYGLTVYPFYLFVTYNLAPSLALNALYYLCCQSYFDRIFLNG